MKTFKNELSTINIQYIELSNTKKISNLVAKKNTL